MLLCRFFFVPIVNPDNDGTDCDTKVWDGPVLQDMKIWKNKREDTVHLLNLKKLKVNKTKSNKAKKA